MKRIITALLSLIIIVTSIPVVSLAEQLEEESIINVMNELSEEEQLLIEKQELGSGIYFNEKYRLTFENELDSEAIFSINQKGFLELNSFIEFDSEDNYESIINYIGKDLTLIISINNDIFNSENHDTDKYIIESVNTNTDIVVFNEDKITDIDETVFLNYLEEVIDNVEDDHKSNDLQSEDNEKITEYDENDLSSGNLDNNSNEETTVSNDDNLSNVIDTTEEQTTNITEEDMTDTEIAVVSQDNLYTNISDETLSEIISGAFLEEEYQGEINSIYVSDELKDIVNSTLKLWYEDSYCLYNNEIRINDSLILNSADNGPLEDGNKYIFLGQDNEGNLLSAKLSDYINKENVLLKLMNSNYSTFIVSYNQLLQSNIEIDSDGYFYLMYCDNQLVIAVNTEKCKQNSIGAKENFNSIINVFLDEYRIESIQPYGIAVGNPIVYSGPGKNGYAAVGSLDPFDPYETIYKELGFQYIEYEVGSTGTYKRGYIDQYGGGSGTIPSNYKSGMGAKVKNGCTVYSGPSTSYSTVGSVSSNEAITLLSTTAINSYYYIEYSSSNGSKRGYISSSNTSTTSKTGLGVTLKDIEVYDDYVVNSGSLYKNEYFVITGVNDSYYRIEYNISTGRKSGYVHKSDVTLVNSSVTIPTIANSSALQAVPALSTNVYAGPSTSIYANIGSVDSSDTVGVLGKEGSYYYIQYSTSSGSKRGYITKSALKSFASDSTVYPTGVESVAAYADAPKTACTVYSCPNSNCATIGSISADEGITVFPSIKDNGYTFVEYSTSSNTKRGFISTSLLKEYNDGVKGKASKDTNIYYTTKADLKLGSIYKEEYVIVLGTTGNYYYIEYNSPSGRKRGYTVKTAINLHSSAGISNIATSGERIKMQSAQIVYSGPSSTYANIGSVSQNEYVVLIDKGTRGWYLIDYSAADTRKQGYVPKSSIASTYIPVNSEISYPQYTNAERHIMENYTSGLGRDLVYYTIGDANSDNILFLNFAIHGHEDIYGGDGMALVKMAFKTILTFDNNYNKILSNDWYIVIVPTFNPDGILVNDNCTGNCTGIGRHNAVQMIKKNGEWIKYTDTTEGKDALGHIDMNRCFPYDAAGNFNQHTSTRNYTGPKDRMAQEAYALSELINTYKNKSGKKYFIDIHGWYNQIIVDTKTIQDSPIGKAFQDNGFNFATRNTSVAPTTSYLKYYSLYNDYGFVARYASALGYTGCLFEFPSDSDPDYLANSTYGTYFINAVKDMVGI